VVVDDEIDIYSSDDVIWAIGTRSEPENIYILRRCWSGPLDPAIPESAKASTHAPISTPPAHTPMS
jgi:UbiD family decarboxylase